jgi:hypothetical protein
MEFLPAKDSKGTPDKLTPELLASIAETSLYAICIHFDALMTVRTAHNLTTAIMA